MRTLPKILLAVVLLVALSSARAEPLTVAVASNFTTPLREIADRYASTTGQSVRIVSGATGALYAQVVNGAPFDLYLAADSERPALLVESGIAPPEALRTYAVGRLVLWHRHAGGPFDGALALRDLDPNDRVAIANPRTAPYGAAAASVLRQLGLDAVLERRLATAQNVAQAYQYAASGNARYAFVGSALVMRDGKFTRGGGWIVPESMHAPILQDAVLLRNDNDARTFFDFLTGEEAAKIIARYGYRVD